MVRKRSTGSGQAPSEDRERGEGERRRGDPERGRVMSIQLSNGI
jgi:hypothetical protein